MSAKGSDAPAAGSPCDVCGRIIVTFTGYTNGWQPLDGCWREAHDGDDSTCYHLGYEREKIRADAATKALLDYAERNATAGGVAVIAAERKRQIEKEGWTPEHDDEHSNGDLAVAAACYAAPGGQLRGDEIREQWPWDDGWKPTPDNRVRELAKAGALIAAEIDRLQRASGKPPAGPSASLSEALTGKEGPEAAAQAERPQAVVFAEGMRQAAIVIGERLRVDFERIYSEEAQTMTEHERQLARKFVGSIASLASEIAAEQPSASLPAGPKDLERAAPPRAIRWGEALETGVWHLWIPAPAVGVRGTACGWRSVVDNGMRPAARGEGPPIGAKICDACLASEGGDATDTRHSGRSSNRQSAGLPATAGAASIDWRGPGPQAPSASAVPATQMGAALEALRALRQQVEDTVGAAQTETDGEWITAYHFKTGAIHRLLALARDHAVDAGPIYRTTGG